MNCDNCGHDIADHDLEADICHDGELVNADPCECDRYEPEVDGYDDPLPTSHQAVIDDHRIHHYPDGWGEPA